MLILSIKTKMKNSIKKIFLSTSYLLMTAVLLSIVVYIVLFSLGIKIDWQNLNLEQTGILSIKTDPAGAKIIIDGQETGSVTPQKLRWILPGRYQVTLIKDGYQPWQKQVEIKPGLVTELKNFSFFLESPRSEKILDSSLILTDDSPATGYFLKKDRQLWFYSLSPRRERKIFNFKYQIKSVTAGPELKQAIINQKRLISLLDGRYLVNLKKELAGFDDFQFRPGTNNYLIAVKNNYLYQIRINDLLKTKLLDFKKYRSYQIEADRILAISREKPFRLISINWRGKKNELATEKLEIATNSQRSKKEIYLKMLELVKFDKDIYFKDKDQNFYIIDNKVLYPLSSQIRNLKSTAENGLIITDNLNNLLLINNPDSFQSRERILVDRSSQRVADFQLLDQNYIVYLTEGKIYVSAIYQAANFAIKTNFQVKKFWLISKKELLVLSKDDQLFKLTIS